MHSSFQMALYLFLPHHKAAKAASGFGTERPEGIPWGAHQYHCGGRQGSFSKAAVIAQPSGCLRRCDIAFEKPVLRFGKGSNLLTF